MTSSAVGSVKVEISVVLGEAKLPILVFNFKREGNIERAIAGHPIGTIVSES